jgi:hypothetical protein
MSRIRADTEGRFQTEDNKGNKDYVLLNLEVLRWLPFDFAQGMLGRANAYRFNDPSTFTAVSLRPIPENEDRSEFDPTQDRVAGSPE